MRGWDFHHAWLELERLRRSHPAPDEVGEVERRPINKRLDVGSAILANKPHHGCELFGAVEITVSKLDCSAEECTPGLLNAMHLLITEDQSYSLAAKFIDDVSCVFVMLYKFVTLVDIDKTGDRVGGSALSRRFNKREKVPALQFFEGAQIIAVGIDDNNFWFVDFFREVDLRLFRFKEPAKDRIGRERDKAGS